MDNEENSDKISKENLKKIEKLKSQSVSKSINSFKNKLETSQEENSMISKNDLQKKVKKGPYTLGKTIGEGAFAKVKLATHNLTHEKIAIKVIDKASLIKEESDIKRLKTEITILKKIRHKKGKINIDKLLFRFNLFLNSFSIKYL